MRLNGRMSVQVASIQSRHSLRLPRGPVTVQPAGTSRKLGHSEYWPSSLTSTRKSPFSSSNGLVIQLIHLLHYFKMSLSGKRLQVNIGHATHLNVVQLEAADQSDRAAWSFEVRRAQVGRIRIQ